MQAPRKFITQEHTKLSEKPSSVKEKIQKANSTIHPNKIENSMPKFMPKTWFSYKFEEYNNTSLETKWKQEHIYKRISILNSTSLQPFVMVWILQIFAVVMVVALK